LLIYPTTLANLYIKSIKEDAKENKTSLISTLLVKLSNAY
jgi:hypothetical protein